MRLLPLEREPTFCTHNGLSIFFVFRWFVTRLCNLIDANRLGTFTFFVIIADATGVGLFAFLAELSSHFSNFLLSKVRPVGCVHPDTTQYSYPCMVRTDHLPVCALGNVVLGCLSLDPIIELLYAACAKETIREGSRETRVGSCRRTVAPLVPRTHKDSFQLSHKGRPDLRD